MKLNINKDVNPVVQPYCRIPIAMIDKLEAHLNGLVEHGIVEKVDGSTTFHYPVTSLICAHGRGTS